MDGAIILLVSVLPTFAYLVFKFIPVWYCSFLLAFIGTYLLLPGGLFFGPIPLFFWGWRFVGLDNFLEDGCLGDGFLPNRIIIWRYSVMFTSIHRIFGTAL